MLIVRAVHNHLLGGRGRRGAGEGKNLSCQLAQAPVTPTTDGKGDGKSVPCTVRLAQALTRYSAYSNNGAIRDSQDVELCVRWQKVVGCPRASVQASLQVQTRKYTGMAVDWGFKTGWPAYAPHRRGLWRR
eukprot:1190375-Prorocentrum_minimum.AAC.4